MSNMPTASAVCAHEPNGWECSRYEACPAFYGPVQHAHVSSQSADCDGRYDRSHIVWPTEEELAEARQDVNDFSDIHFRERVLGSVVSLTTFVDGQRGTVEITEHGFDWSRPTDEGFESAHVTWCDGFCDDDSTYRDHSAERAGY